MRVEFSAEEEGFRREVAEFLADYRDLDGFFGAVAEWSAVERLFQAMGERGWLGLERSK